jgi:hypothetical protein
MRRIINRFIEHKVAFDGTQDNMVIELRKPFDKLHKPGQLEGGDLIITKLFNPNPSLYATNSI